MKKVLPRLSELMLYLYVFLIPWQTRWIIKPGSLNGESWEYGTYSLYGTEILLIGLLILQMIQIGKTKRQGKKRVISGIDLAVAGIVIISGLSFFWAIHQALTLYVWLKMLEGVGLVWIIRHQKYSLTWLARAFIGGAASQAIIGIGQFFSQTVVSSKWLGIAGHDAGQLGTYVIETATNRFLRAYGGLPHPNILAGFMVIAVLIICGLYFDLYRRIYYWFESLSFDARKKIWQYHRDQILKFTVEVVYYLFCLAVCFLALILSFSRSGWLALGCGLIFMLITALIKRDRKKWYVILKLIVVMLLIVGITSILLNGLITSRFNADQRLETISLNERKDHLHQAVELFKDSWVVGVGLGNYTQAVFDKINSRWSAWDYQPVHNVYLLAAVELSLIGLVALIFLIFEIIRAVIKNIFLNRYLDRWSLVSSAGVLSLLIIGLFDHYLWSLYPGILLWWFSLGLFSRSIKKNLSKIS